MTKQYRILQIFIFTILCVFLSCNSENQSIKSKNFVEEQLSSPFFQQLYSSTYYDLISRIEDDGFLQESMTGRYSGMYSRTVGATVSLLLETGQIALAEKMINCVFDAMKSNNMDRVPHAFDRKKYINEPVSKDNQYRIIGRTDQIDGQAHVILAWARLILKNGSSIFEDTTWNYVADLMNRSSQKPYLGNDENGKIPDLVHNYAFEHSRLVPANYDLLSQCFIGAALESMIEVAKKRDENMYAEKWQDRLILLQAGIKRNMIRIVDEKQVYLELLLKENGDNIPFQGMGWVNLSPVAAQWEPLEHKILVNTVEELRKCSLQKWNNITWMPTDWWPNGKFSGQMIGKGIGWEVEYSRKEEEWGRISEILKMLELVQYKQPIYMENSYLFDGSSKDIYNLSSTELNDFEQGVWKLADPGNGEQVSWWLWAMARLRKEVELPAIPQKMIKKEDLKIKLDKNNGLEFNYHSILETDSVLSWISKSPQKTGSCEYFNLKEICPENNIYGVTWHGYLNNVSPGHYQFYTYSPNYSELYINDQKVANTGVESKSIMLDENYFEIRLILEHRINSDCIEIFYHKTDEPKEKIKPSYLYKTDPMINKLSRPEIFPLKSEFEIGENLEISIQSNHDDVKLFYTSDNSTPTRNSIQYHKPFRIDSSTIIKAIAVKENMIASDIGIFKYTQTNQKSRLILEHQPHPNYQSLGAKTLVDGYRGTLNHSDGCWLGFEGEDIILTIDLRKMTNIDKIETTFLHNQGAWIFMPEKVLYEISNDGVVFKTVYEQTNLISDNWMDLKTFTKNFTVELENTKVQYIRILGKNIGVCPKWHTGTGGKAWIFIDEVIVK